MELLAKLLLNSLYGEQIGKNIEEDFVSKSEYWMLAEIDGRVKDYWSIGNSKYIVKLARDEGKKYDSDKVNVIPLHLGAFVPSNSKRIKKNFVGVIGGLKSIDVYYGY